jgi:hypothetical protein
VTLFGVGAMASRLDAQKSCVSQALPLANVYEMFYFLLCE